MSLKWAMIVQVHTGILGVLNFCILVLLETLDIRDFEYNCNYKDALIQSYLGQNKSTDQNNRR